MPAVEADKAVLNQGMTEAISGRGERIGYGRVHVRIVTLVIPFPQQFQPEYSHHVLTYVKYVLYFFLFFSSIRLPLDFWTRQLVKSE